MGGGLVAAINIGAVWALLQWPLLASSEVGKNIAHIAGTEFALLCSFHIHNYWTWRRRSDSYLRKLWEFHAVTGFTIGLRIIIFFVLNRLGVDPLLATIAGIAVAVVLNFLGYDKIVFKKGKHQDGELAASEPKADLSPPEKDA